MLHTADKLERGRTREVFSECLARTDDYRQAAKAAGVSERTGRRWLARTRPTPAAVVPAPERWLRSPEVTDVTSFVGRDADLRALDKLFDGGARLVTVCGPPGMGKTRLQREFARRVRKNTRQDVWFCDLTTATSLEDICRAVSSTLRVPLTASRADAAVGQLTQTLAQGGPVLLALDNFEQLVQFAPAVLPLWLAGAPELRILVGSRSRLRLVGEHVYELGPLELPGAAAEGLAAIEQSEAGRLFLARAAKVRSGPGLSDAELKLVGGLLRWLEGIPLAIEIAAAQLAHLGVAEVLERSTRRIDLTDSRHDVDPRHSTVRAAIDTSWSLLSPTEKCALARATVFRGGFGLDAAQAGGASFPPDLVLNTIASLREKSLLRAEPQAELDGRLRFSLYESIREYADERLKPDLRRANADWHGRHYLAMGERLAEAVRGPDGPAALSQLAADLDNLVAVHARALERPDNEGALEALRAALAIHPLLTDRGPAALNLSLLDRALRAAQRAEVPALWLAKGHMARSEARRVLGALQGARADLKAARALCPHDVELQAELDWVAALSAWHSGDLVEHERCARRGLRRLRGLEMPGLQGRLQHALGVAVGEQGRLEEAEDHFLQGQALLKKAKDLRSEADLQAHFAHFHLQLRRSDTLTQLNEALRLAEAFGNHRLIARTQLDLGQAEHDMGRLHQSQQHYLRSLQLFRGVGPKRNEGVVLFVIGQLHLEQGALAEAERWMRSGYEIAKESGDDRLMGFCMLLLAGLEANMGRVDRAEKLLASGARLTRATGDRLAIGVAEVQWGQVELAKARRAEVKGQLRRVRKLRADVAQRIAELEGDGLALELPPSERPVAGRSEDVRIALRLLKQRLAADEAAATDAEASCRVDQNGRWFELSPQSRISLDGRDAPRRILAALARHRIEAPGTTLAADQLIRAGWGNDPILPEAAAYRLRTAVSRLRTLGLRGALLSAGGGYLLDPRVRVELATNQN